MEPPRSDGQDGYDEEEEDESDDDTTVEEDSSGWEETNDGTDDVNELQIQPGLWKNCSLQLNQLIPWL